MKKIKWTNHQVRLRDIKPNEINPRKITQEQREQLKESLRKFGLAEVPILNYDNVLIAGHQRYDQLCELRKKDSLVDVRKPDRQLTEEEAAEYMIRSNRNK